MKTQIISLFFLLSAATTFGQTSNDTIVVAPGASGMYFYHVVEKGETLQSLSQKYGLREGQLAGLNHMNTANDLETYGLIKIPINKNNVIQSGGASAHTGLTPLYHKVLKGETLFRVGKIYGDVPLSDIRQWNHLQGNNINTGQYLIIGWLKAHPVASGSFPAQSKQQNTTTASSSDQPQQAATSAGSAEIKPSAGHTSEGKAFLREVIVSEKHRTTRSIEEMADREPVSKPLLAARTSASTSGPPAPQDQNGSTPVSKPLLQTNPGPSGQEPVPGPSEHSQEQTASPDLAKQKKTHPSQSDIGTAKEENPFEKMLNEVTHKPVQSSKPSAPKPTTQQVSITEPTTIAQEKGDATILQPSTTHDHADSASLKLAQKSLFSELYLAQTQNEKVINSKKGAASWFKSNVKSGSKKYYALCNDLPRGTIVKVINPINKKYVYVKVLAPIPQQKENYNLIIKLSDAAMNDLGTSQPRFWSKIVFPKVKGGNTVE